MSLIPFAAAALARKDHAEADRIISSAFRLIAILALPAGVGLSVLSTPIERLMLPMQPEDALAAGPHLQILGIALIFICLMILTNAILQTYGKEKLPIFTVIAGGVVKVVMNYILVGNPDISIHGAPISTLCCYLTICGLNLFFVWKYSPEKPRYTRLFGKPIVASAVMGAAAWAVCGLVARVLNGHSAYGANALATFCGILAGVVVTVPVAFYNIYAFAKPGLKKSESTFFKLVMLLGLILFCVGVLFAYKLMMPFMLRFLSTGIEGAEYIQTTTSIESYVNLCLTMFIIFGCVFEMPLITIILSKMGIINPQILKQVRGVAIVVIFFIAAVVTPPDIVSQCMVALPMVLLYFVSIFLSGIFYKPHDTDEDDEDEEEEEAESKD